MTRPAFLARPAGPCPKVTDHLRGKAKRDALESVVKNASITSEPVHPAQDCDAVLASAQQIEGVPAEVPTVIPKSGPEVREEET